jgi:hypothetical protein
LKRLAVILVSAAALSARAQNISDQYGETAQKLIAAALRDTDGLARLQYLCDRIGNRLSGSASLEHAIEWFGGRDEKGWTFKRPDAAGQGSALGAWRRISRHDRAH